jgi:ankyrin repeat protein
VFEALCLSKTPTDYKFVKNQEYLDLILGYGNEKDLHDFIVFHFQNRNIEYVKFLCDKTSFDDYYSLLYHARDVDSLEFLLSKGITVEDLRSNDNLILNNIIKENNFESVDFLMSIGFNMNDIRSAFASTNQIDMIILFRSYGLNLQDVIYLLINSAKLGYLDMVDFLIISFGLTTEDLRHDDNNALYYAIINDHLDVVKLLLKHGLDVQDIKSDGFTIAVQKGYFEMIKFLINQGLTADDLRVSGNEALTTASMFGHFNIVKLLIDNGINSKDIIQSDAISIASAFLYYDIVNLLTETVQKDNM